MAKPPQLPGSHSTSLTDQMFPVGNTIFKYKYYYYGLILINTRFNFKWGLKIHFLPLPFAIYFLATEYSWTVSKNLKHFITLQCW